jgi:hypothetical protein
LPTELWQTAAGLLAGALPVPANLKSSPEALGGMRGTPTPSITAIAIVFGPGEAAGRDCRGTALVAGLLAPIQPDARRNACFPAHPETGIGVFEDKSNRLVVTGVQAQGEKSIL